MNLVGWFHASQKRGSLQIWTVALLRHKVRSVQVRWSEQSIATCTVLWFLLQQTKSRWNTIRVHSCEGKVKIFWVCLDKAAVSSHAMCQPLVNLPVSTSHRHIPSFSTALSLRNTSVCHYTAHLRNGAQKPEDACFTVITSRVCFK